MRFGLRKTGDAGATVKKKDLLTITSASQISLTFFFKALKLSNNELKEVP